MNERYAVLKYIDDRWTIVGYYTSPIEINEDDTIAVYDQQQQRLISYNIPKGSPLETLLNLAILKQIEAHLAGKENPPGPFLL